MSQTRKRIFRLFDFEVRQRISQGNRWRRMAVDTFANAIQNLPLDSTITQNRYMNHNGESWYIDFPIIGPSTSNPGFTEILGTAWRCRREDLPYLERAGATSKIHLQNDQTIAEANAFGIFSDNSGRSHMLLQVSRHGLRAADIEKLLRELGDRLVSINTWPDINVTISLVTRGDFIKTMRNLVAFTRLHMRPKFDAIGRITSSEGGVIASVYQILTRRIHRPPELNLSLGRNPNPDDAFLHEFAGWLSEHAEDAKNNLFEILEGSALIRTGELVPFDIMDRHKVEKRKEVLFTNGYMDFDDAFRIIRATYYELRRQL